MIGDPAWLDFLDVAYMEHCAMAARRNRAALPFEEWARERTWEDFARIVRVAQRVPKFALSDWATENPIAMVGGRAYRSRVLARRIIDAVVMSQTVMKALQRHSRKAYRAAQTYFEDGRVAPDQRPSLTRAKRFVFDWLRSAATEEAHSSVAAR